MSRPRLRVVVGIGVLCAGSSLMANAIVSGGGIWNPVPTCASGAPACAAPAGTPFWFNGSQDDGVLAPIAGHPRNLASIVNGTSPYSALPAFADASWYGQADGASAIQDLFFGGVGTYNVSLLVAETGQNLILGWYGFDNGGAIVEGGLLMGRLGTNAGTTGILPAQFASTTGRFGFFLKYGRPTDCQAGDWRAVCAGTIVDHAGGTGVPLDILYSQSARNSSAAHPSPGAPGNAYYEGDLESNRQHFLAIQTAQGLLLGVEDGWSSRQQYGTLNTQFGGPVWERAGDFNDMVLLITAVPPIASVPEASTMALFGLGIAGLAAYQRKRRA